ncbi:hypothetical protein BGZ81_004268 [Podila clonocystis]|nr:hypothetical protein BGZ81_004268 [Podila clonocystis]
MSFTNDIFYQVFQHFESQDGERLGNLPTHLMTSGTVKRYVLWNDVQDAFKGVDHVTRYSIRVPFEIDENENVLRPLQIEYSSQPYTVVNRNTQEGHTEGFTQALQTRLQISSRNLAPKEIRLDDLFTKYRDICMYIESNNMFIRGIFQRIAANARYYCEMIELELKRLDAEGVEVLVHGMDRKQVLIKLQDWKQKVEMCGHQHTFYRTIAETDSSWEFATSKLFIVLPSSLNSWDDSSTSTHKLRLYFLCDTSAPQRVHLSNHSGYSLNRQFDFIQTYGDYALRMLQMIKYGYKGDHHYVPPLDTVEILCHCDTNIMGSQLSKDTMASLVDKAIAYIQGFAPPKWPNPKMTRSQSSAIKTYLEVQDGENAEGDLQRLCTDNSDVHWICQAHTPQFFQTKYLKSLEDFLRYQGGIFDMQQARLTIELRSNIEAHQICPLLAEFTPRFNISIKLGWTATRLEVEKLFWDLAKTNASILEVDGISVDIHPQDYVHYTPRSITVGATRRSRFRHLRLLNYPRPGEHSVYMSKFSLRLHSSPEQYSYSWVDLRDDLDEFSLKLSRSKVATDWKAAAEVLRLILMKHSLSGITKITMYNRDRSGEPVPQAEMFGQEAASFIEVYSFGMRLPEVLLAYGPTEMLRQQPLDTENDQVLYCLLLAKKGSQNLNTLAVGRRVLHHAENNTHLGRNFPRPLRLTFIECVQGTRDRIAAQVTIGEINLYTDHIEAENGKWEVPANPMPLEWRSPLSDEYAYFLDKATEKASAIALLTLDTTQLTPFGLDHIQRAVRQSRLEFLHVACRDVDHKQSASIGQILHSVDWSTLKSLVLFGDHVEAWMSLWNKFEKQSTINAPRLLSLYIGGSSLEPQLLSHTSALFIHHLIYSSPLVEMFFQNVMLRDKRDWRFIVDVFDPLVLETIGLCSSSTVQLKEAKEAWEIFQAKFEIDERDQGARIDERDQGARSDERDQGARSDERDQGARSEDALREAALAAFTVDVNDVAEPIKVIEVIRFHPILSAVSIA